MPKSIKLGTNYLWVKGIQVYSRPGLLQRGDNHKNGVGSFKIFFVSTMKPEKLNFT
jgi:hypothetical protein